MYLRSWILPLSRSDFLFSLSEKQTETAIQYTDLISDSISTRAFSELPLLIYLVR